MSDVTKFIWALIVGLLIRLYTAFVALNLWNWFAVEAFHASTISFFLMYGLLLLVELFWETEEQKAGYRWKSLFTVLDFCVPEEKRQAVNQAIEEQKTAIWLDAGMQAFGKLIGDTTILGLGFVVHILAS
ncbi:MAG: hypothetical protein DMG16_27015 [Acidobacteria bacterium]|nr:MAG: hypothetical protein DMG16_27015 [Acidobacteriota bacterium]